MASILVHITHGPEHPTRAALGFHVAKAAIDEGHSVTMFLAGDGVQLMREGAIDSLIGLGTGNLRELYDAVVASGTTIYLSGMSSKARGLSESEWHNRPRYFIVASRQRPVDQILGAVDVAWDVHLSAAGGDPRAARGSLGRAPAKSRPRTAERLGCRG